MATARATSVSRSKQRRKLIALAGVVLAVALTPIGSVYADPATLAPGDARSVESTVQGTECLAGTTASDLILPQRYRWLRLLAGGSTSIRSSGPAAASCPSTRRVIGGATRSTSPRRIGNRPVRGLRLRTGTTEMPQVRVQLVLCDLDTAPGCRPTGESLRVLDRPQPLGWRHQRALSAIVSRGRRSTFPASRTNSRTHHSG
jgi:hypothetical protein